MARFWYAFTGWYGADPTLAQNYSIIIPVNLACLNGSTVCAIYAPGGDYSPQPLSRNMRRYIAAALATGVSQPQASGNPKQYVYLKTL
jgi:hypothetical protein